MTTQPVHPVSPPPSLLIQSLHGRADALGKDIDQLCFLLSAASHDDPAGERLKEAHRLITLAEELYERAEKLVKQAEELLPPDDLPTPEKSE